MKDPTPTQGTLPVPLTDAELAEMLEEATNMAMHQSAARYLRLMNEHAALKKVLQAVDEFRTSDLTDKLLSYGIDDDSAEDVSDDIDSELYVALQGARHLLVVR